MTQGELYNKLRDIGAWQMWSYHHDGTATVTGGVTFDEFTRGTYEGGRFYARYEPSPDWHNWEERQRSMRPVATSIKAPGQPEIHGIEPEALIAALQKLRAA